MGAEQIVVFALVVAAFAAGRFSVEAPWRRRGARTDAPPAVEAEEPRRLYEPSTTAGARRARAAGSRSAGDGERVPADARAGAADVSRALDRAVTALESAVDRWLDERDAITPAGRAAVAEVGRAVQRLDVAVARLREREPEPERSEVVAAAEDALDALREAAALLDRFRAGRSLDAATSGELTVCEDEVERARVELRELAER